MSTDDQISNDTAEAVGESVAALAIRRAIQVAWMAILAGIAVQLLVFLGRRFGGGAWPGIAAFAEMAQSVSWGVIVCVGLAIGTAAMRSRQLVMGLLGLISGPLGWGAAKGVQRSVQMVMGVAVDPIPPFFWQLCAVKGVEYAILGGMLAVFSARPHVTWKPFALLGAGLGIASAIAVTGINAANAPLPPPKLFGLAAGEFFFPVACALVIYLALRLKRMAMPPT
jgi:hypothetical protein